MKRLSHYHRLTLSIGLCSIVTFFNLYWLQPVLPLLQQDFGVTALAANMAMSSSMLGMGIGLLVFATWSDAIGRCKILLWGTGFALAMTFLLPLVHNYPLFLSIRFIQGMLLSVCPAVAVPLLGDELRRHLLPAAVGIYIASNSIGGITSRLISGFCAELGGDWQAAGWVIGGVTLVLFMIVVKILPSQKRFKATPFKLSKSLKAYAGHMRRPELVLTYLIVGLVFGSFVNLFSYLMLVLGDAPYSLPSDIRSLLFVTFFGGTISSSMAGQFSKKHGQLAGIATGVSVMLAACLCLESGYMPLMIVGMIGAAVGFFFCHAQASTFVGRNVKEAKGSAQALYSLFYYMGASFGPFYLEPFFQRWGWQGVVSGIGSALLLCLILVTINWRWCARHDLAGLHNGLRAA